MRLHYTGDEIAAFVRDGADPAERMRIAAQMNCCDASVIQDICRSYGIQAAFTVRKVGRSSTLTPGKIHQMLEALRVGTKRSEIAKMLGVHPSTVTYWAKKLKIEKAPK